MVGLGWLLRPKNNIGDDMLKPEPKKKFTPEENTVFGFLGWGFGYIVIFILAGSYDPTLLQIHGFGLILTLLFGAIPAMMIGFIPLMLIEHILNLRYAKWETERDLLQFELQQEKQTKEQRRVSKRNNIEAKVLAELEHDIFNS